MEKLPDCHFLQLLKFIMCSHFTSNIYIASINVSNGIMIKFKSCFSIFMVYDHFAAFHTANHYLLETAPLVSITLNSPSSVSWTTLCQVFFTECLSSLLLVLFTCHYYSLSQNCLCILFLYHLYKSGMKSESWTLTSLRNLRHVSSAPYWKFVLNILQAPQIHPRLKSNCWLCPILHH